MLLFFTKANYGNSRMGVLSVNYDKQKEGEKESITNVNMWLPVVGTSIKQKSMVI